MSCAVFTKTVMRETAGRGIKKGKPPLTGGREVLRPLTSACCRRDTLGKRKILYFALRKNKEFSFKQPRHRGVLGRSPFPQTRYCADASEENMQTCQRLPRSVYVGPGETKSHSYRGHGRVTGSGENINLRRKYEARRVCNQHLYPPPQHCQPDRCRQ